MSAGAIRTVDDALDEIRDELDEELDVDTNFWTNDFLLKRLNRGLREVWQTARETHENWFIRKVRSTDPPLTIFDRAYDPSQLALVDGRTELVLPPDLYEVRLFEAISSSTDETVDDSIIFHFKSMNSDTFRALKHTQGPSEGGSYRVDVVWRSDGPRLLVAPAVNLSTSLDVELQYVMATKHYVAGQKFENSGFSDIMLDAAVAYAVVEARRKEGSQGDLQVALQDFQQKVELVKRSAGPRQTVEDEIVEGFLEEEI